jgi:N-acetyltransferase
MSFDPRPILLQGRHVRLEPLAPHHAPGLFAVGQDPAIWRWMLTPAFASLAEVEKLIEDILRNQAAGAEVAWATVRQSDNAVVGSTRFFDIRRPHRVLEIGYTWLTPSAQRTAINTEAKLLQLRHAFDDLGAVRVQWKTDERNEASRRAILRLGARFEGILRKFQTRSDGFIRNTAMFSMTDEEWPEARTRLEASLLR